MSVELLKVVSQILALYIFFLSFFIYLCQQQEISAAEYYADEADADLEDVLGQRVPQGRSSGFFSKYLY